MPEVLTVTSFNSQKKAFFWTTLLTPSEPRLKQLQEYKLLEKEVVTEQLSSSFHLW